jgi:hypothetical protein
LLAEDIATNRTVVLFEGDGEDMTPVATGDEIETIPVGRM